MIFHNTKFSTCCVYEVLIGFHHMEADISVYVVAENIEDAFTIARYAEPIGYIKQAILIAEKAWYAQN